jgi:hypothetical protein
MKILAYYGPRTGGKEFRYFPEGRWPREGPDWYISHSLQAKGKIPTTLADAHGNEYVLVKIVPHAGLSGWGWFLYRNVGSAGARRISAVPGNFESK